MKNLIGRAIALVDNTVFEGLALFAVRLALAAQFWRSALTKIEGYNPFDIKDTTYFLFQEEYHMPFPEITGALATYGEYFLSILVFLGLATRFGAAGLFTMTLVIQLFVYPDAFWSPHVMWFGLALILIARGGGMFSLDRLVGPRLLPAKA